MDYLEFKTELEDMIYDCEFMFNQKLYYFDNKYYPDIEAVLMLNAFSRSINSQILLQRIHEKISTEQLDRYSHAMSNYKEQKTEFNYKEIGKIIVPIAENIINEINSTPMITDQIITDPKGHYKSAYEKNIEKKIEELKQQLDCLIPKNETVYEKIDFLKISNTKEEIKRLENVLLQYRNS